MANQIKIAFMHFYTFRMRRGIETLVLSLANELAKHDVKVSILAASQTQRPLVVASPGVRVKQFPTFRYYESTTIVPFYVADLVYQQYDIVVVFFADFGEGWALHLASPFTRPRLFLYLAYPYEAAPHRYHSFQRWGWGKKASRILADAEYTARRGAEFFKRKVQLLPGGTDPNRFRPDPQRRAVMRQQFGFGDRDVVLLNVAALEERKGVWRMIEALPEIRTRCPNVRYLILGDGPQKTMLQRRVEELALTEYVVFAGTTADLPQYYNAADIFVMLADAEAGSIACLEAMASGLPVVVSDAGGFAEVVSKRNGRIVDIDHPAALVEAVTELAQNEVLRKNLGEVGRNVIVERFSWEKIAELFHQLAQEEIQSANPHRITSVI